MLQRRIFILKQYCMRQLLFIIITTVCSNFSSYSQGESPLLSAIRQNDLAQVTTLLNQGYPLAAVDSDSDHVLMYAALYASRECMKLLLDKGANPNMRNKLGETALVWSVHDISKVKLLLDHGADANALTNEGNTPLLAACVGQGQNEVISLLLEKGANALARNARNETTLMRVSLYGDTSIARLLLNKGVDINEKNNNAETALLMCSRTANNDMAGWLLDNGADVNILDNYKATALSYAIVVCNAAVIKRMVLQTKDINQVDIDGVSFLMWAAYSENDRPEILQLLLDNGASAKYKDGKGASALSWAMKKGNTASVVLLKKWMIDDR
jgi:ankyrin repeat protein